MGIIFIVLYLYNWSDDSGPDQGSLVIRLQETKKGEVKSEEVIRWLHRLAKENPALFGRGGLWKITAVKEQQASSHVTGTYQIDSIKVHVKFFRRTLGRTCTTYEPCQGMEAEYASLKDYERRGFTSGRYQVARALGINERMDCALATLYVDGVSLQSLIVDVVRGKRSPADLYMGLELTAGLIRRIHTDMPQSYSLDQCEMFYSYLKALIHLEEMDALGGYHRKVMRSMARWYDYRPLFQQRGVTIHGDANPSNFKIKDGIIYAFDVERSRPRRSRCLDLGSITADLWHHFAREADDGSKAGPYVSHFLQSYEPDHRQRKEIDAILPFYVSQSLFKIATLGYWDAEYRKRLVEEGARRAEEVPR